MTTAVVLGVPCFFSDGKVTHWVTLPLAFCLKPNNLIQKGLYGGGMRSHNAFSSGETKGMFMVQYLRHLEGMDCMVNPSEFSHLCNRLINKNRLWHFRKQF